MASSKFAAFKEKNGLGQTAPAPTPEAAAPAESTAPAEPAKRKPGRPPKSAAPASTDAPAPQAPDESMRKTMVFPGTFAPIVVEADARDLVDVAALFIHS